MFSLVTSGIHVSLIFYVLILLQECEYLVWCVWSQIFDNLGCGDWKIESPYFRYQELA